MIECGLRPESGSLAPGIVGSNPAGSMEVGVCCVMLGRGVCVGVITRPQESCRVCGCA